VGGVDTPMTSCSGRPPEIHLFEPTGFSGIFQHTCQLAGALSRHGRRVVLHTGHEHEDIRLAGVEICKCSWWPRSKGTGALATRARKATIASLLVTRTVPHLVRSVPRDSVLHLQGPAASGILNLLTLSVSRSAHHRVVYSPHNLFSRNGRLDAAFMRLANRVPDAIVVYSQADVQRLRGKSRCPVHCSPLIMPDPLPPQQEQVNWRTAWRADKAVLFAGDVRPDKRLDLLIESARSWPPGRRLAVVGRDNGDWARCAALASDYNLDIAACAEFVDLGRFAAAIAAADVVVVPSDRASQSAVLALARQLRTPTVAADVGGMAELASDTFRVGDVDDLSRAIQSVLDDSSPAVEPLDDDEAVHVHLRAYGVEP
jgi:glycosyltransferase involved in cell wall biosynthesis